MSVERHGRIAVPPRSSSRPQNGREPGVAGSLHSGGAGNRTGEEREVTRRESRDTVASRFPLGLVPGYKMVEASKVEASTQWRRRESKPSPDADSQENKVIREPCDESNCPEDEAKSAIAGPVTIAPERFVDPIEAALAKALEGATAAGEWSTVAQLARELEARRKAGATA
jgi:hypothetical protein